MQRKYIDNWPFVEKDVIKNAQEEERLFTAVVLRPEVVDSHGDIYSYDVVKQAAHDFSRLLGVAGANVQHMIDVDKGQMEFVESFIAPIDMSYEMGDVKKGDWVMTAKIHDDTLWEMCKDGTFTGFSVGCSSLVEMLDK